jgi:hypothetical protein
MGRWGDTYLVRRIQWKDRTQKTLVTRGGDFRDGEVKFKREKTGYKLVTLNRRRFQGFSHHGHHWPSPLGLLLARLLGCPFRPIHFPAIFLILRHFTIILACIVNTLIQKSPNSHKLAIFVAGEKINLLVPGLFFFWVNFNKVSTNK